MDRFQRAATCCQKRADNALVQRVALALLIEMARA